MTFRILGIVLPVFVILMVIVFIRKIPGRTLAEEGKREVPHTVTRESRVLNEEWAFRRWTIREAAGTNQFWLFVLSLFFTNFMLHSVFAHQVAFFVDQGESALHASYIAGLIGMVSIAGKIVWGGISDRIGREATHLIGTACSVCGIGLLILFTIYPNAALPYFFALFFGMGYAAITTLSPLIAADFFEGETYGRILGVLFLSITLGGACGVGLTGFLFDLAKSYVPAFFLLIACTLSSFVSIWLAAPRKIRSVPGRSPGKQR
jgi:MFS family permease